MKALLAATAVIAGTVTGCGATAQTVYSFETPQTGSNLYRPMPSEGVLAGEDAAIDLVTITPTGSAPVAAVPETGR